MIVSADPAYIETLVTADGTTTYPALIDPAERWNGFVIPYFTLGTVRRIAEVHAALAVRDGYDFAPTIHVHEGGVNAEGDPRALVLKIEWTWFDQDGPDSGNVLKPTEDGYYCVGAYEWAWAVVEGHPGS
ncbi:hypothetical protein [Streptomyces sp. NRRL S-87]|uniref:hypothetical protein n=1 Tax=Streptomyces sp. NRRL S-87 TaxID=1463920 RepID=UPI0004C1D11D|nr:hypothetical protein [Streptomyces sp. NRRL S-87]